MVTKNAQSLFTSFYLCTLEIFLLLQNFISFLNSFLVVSIIQCIYGDKSVKKWSTNLNDDRQTWVKKNLHKLTKLGKTIGNFKSPSYSVIKCSHNYLTASYKNWPTCALNRIVSPCIKIEPQIRVIHTINRSQPALVDIHMASPRHLGLSSLTNYRPRRGSTLRKSVVISVDNGRALVLQWVFSCMYDHMALEPVVALLASKTVYLF